jgi:hypothetical protein
MSKKPAVFFSLRSFQGHGLLNTLYGLPDNSKEVFKPVYMSNALAMMTKNPHAVCRTKETQPERERSPYVLIAEPA